MLLRLLKAVRILRFCDNEDDLERADTVCMLDRRGGKRKEENLIRQLKR